MDYKKAIKFLTQSRKEIAPKIKVSERTINRRMNNESTPKPCNIDDLKLYFNKVLDEMVRIRNS